MLLKDALLSLQKDNDDHWTSDGAPRLDVLKELVGHDVTREDVTNEMPEFNRDAAGATDEPVAPADAAADSTPVDESAADAGEDTVEGQGEDTVAGDDEPLQEGDTPDAVHPVYPEEDGNALNIVTDEDVDQIFEEGNGAAEVDPAEGEIVEDPGLPDEEVMDPAEKAIRDRLAELATADAELDQEIAAKQKEQAAVKKETGFLLERLQQREGQGSEKRRVNATMNFIESQNTTRKAKADAAAVLKGAGLENVLKAIGGSALDRALKARKPDPSSVRRPPRTPK